MPHSPEDKRIAARKRRYGLTDMALKEIILQQDGKCPMCGMKLTDAQCTAVDHDHRCCHGEISCGRCVRGVLCLKCNSALGMLGDNSIVLQRAAVYLRRVPNAE